MACGEAVETTEGYLGLCRGTMSYPCGIEWCSTSVQIPYPCGIKMCRGWFGIRYPCGI
jgi:hypothetical protein